MGQLRIVGSAQLPAQTDALSKWADQVVVRNVLVGSPKGQCCHADHASYLVAGGRKVGKARK